MHRRILSLVLCAFALMACGGSDVTTPPPLTVFAASSLRDVLSEIASEWTRQGGVTPQLRFEASSTLARQLRDGATADVFVSAAPEWVDVVQPLARHDWLSNTLVLVVRADAPDVALDSLASLAVAGEQVPAGAYARAALQHRGVALPTRTINGANVRAVLAIVSQGGAQAGIVYATDAAIDSTVRISQTFPATSHPRIVYSSALLRENGRAFFDALQSPWAIAIARRHGFVVLP